MQNPFEATARLRKAIRLLDVLQAAGATHARAIEDLSDADWSRAALLAGTHPPSAKTRAVVAELAAYRSRIGRAS
jgi:hypothetical protein